MIAGPSVGLDSFIVVRFVPLRSSAFHYPSLKEICQDFCLRVTNRESEGITWKHVMPLTRKNFLPAKCKSTWLAVSQGTATVAQILCLPTLQAKFVLGSLQRTGVRLWQPQRAAYSVDSEIVFLISESVSSPMEPIVKFSVVQN